MVYNASTDSSCCPAAHTTSLSGSVHNTLDNVDRLALLASTACRVPRVSERAFDDLCPEMVPLLIAALPLTSWYKKDVDLVSSSSICAGHSSKRLKANNGGWSAAMSTSGSVGLDYEDDVNDSECWGYDRSPIVFGSPISGPDVSIAKGYRTKKPVIKDTNRRILPLPKGAKQPEPVRLRERFLKSLIQPKHLPGAKARKTIEERLHFLQRDPWVDIKSVGRQRVVCNECREIVKLDSRGNAAYYPNAWLRHRRRCLVIYRTWLAENGYDDPTWIQKAERRRSARLRMSLKEV